MINDILKKLNFPAIGLIMTGIINICWGLLGIFSMILRWTGVRQNQIPDDADERLGYYFAFIIIILSLLLAPIIIYGAVMMLKGKRFELAKTAAVLAIIPFTSCCFVIGIPFGVWALVVLSKPEVKAIFSE